jgi:hypothetical protein
MEIRLHKNARTTPQIRSTCRRCPMSASGPICSSPSTARRAGSAWNCSTINTPPAPLPSSNACATPRLQLTHDLTDIGKEFSDRFCATGERKPTGRHPQTNGMVERSSASTVASPRSSEPNAFAPVNIDTLTRYMHLYNQHIAQQALGDVPPIKALQQWHRERPELFVEVPRKNLTRRDSNHVDGSGACPRSATLTNDTTPRASTQDSGLPNFRGPNTRL